MSYDSESETPIIPPESSEVLIDRTRKEAFKLLMEPPCILDADFLLGVIELGDRLERLTTS